MASASWGLMSTLRHRSLVWLGAGTGPRGKGEVRLGRERAIGGRGKKYEKKTGFVCEIKDGGIERNGGESL